MKKIAIWGFGITGQAALKYFLNTKKFNEFKIDIYENNTIDDFENVLQDIKNSYEKQNFDEKVNFYFNINEIKKVEQYEMILISPSVSPKNKTLQNAYKKNIKVINDVALFLREWKEIGVSIGVTGSNGKSTIVTLIHKTLEKIGLESILVGNIGKSPLEYLNEYKTNDKRNPIAVIELSSFQLETFTENDFVDIAVITNITPNHLDRHNNDIQEYADAKLKILNKTHTKLVTVLDDLGIQKYILPNVKNTKIFPISLSDNTNQTLKVCENQKIIEPFLDEKSRKLKGVHNLYNIAIVLKVLDLLEIKLPNKKIENFIKNYGGLEHRLEIVKSIKKVIYVNDSKSTSPDATRVALEALGDEKNIILIAGGEDKKVSYSNWSDLLNQHVKKMIILDHDINKKLINLATENKINYIVVKDMESAVKSASQNSKEGDIVLLSPGSSSHGRYKNFEERGKIFKTAVCSL